MVLAANGVTLGDYKGKTTIGMEVFKDQALTASLLFPV